MTCPKSSLLTAPCIKRMGHGALIAMICMPKIDGECQALTRKGFKEKPTLGIDETGATLNPEQSKKTERWE